jgi:hypothetical protein
MTSTTKKVLVGAAIVLILALAGGVWWFSHSLDSLVALGKGDSPLFLLSARVTVEISP